MSPYSLNIDTIHGNLFYMNSRILEESLELGERIKRGLSRIKAYEKLHAGGHCEDSVLRREQSHYESVCADIQRSLDRIDDQQATLLRLANAYDTMIDRLEEAQRAGRDEGESWKWN